MKPNARLAFVLVLLQVIFYTVLFFQSSSIRREPSLMFSTTAGTNELYEYYEQFRDMYYVHTQREAPAIEVNFLFGTIISHNNDVVGFCDTLGETLIAIDFEAWQSLSGLEREQLVFHELGHCVLGRPDTDEIKDNLPSSIMHLNMIDEQVYSKNRAEYLEELFSNE